MPDRRPLRMARALIGWEGGEEGENALRDRAGKPLQPLQSLLLLPRGLPRLLLFPLLLLPFLLLAARCWCCCHMTPQLVIVGGLGAGGGVGAE